MKLSIVEIIEDSSVIGERFHYLPHHAVISPEKSTTKIRIVYDGSAKEKKGNLSRNENLFHGPIILEDLAGLLMRLRTKQVAIVADIEKAYLQVGLLPQDRDVTRFLWVKNLKEPLSSRNL